jgi:hypothetical protein
MDSKHTKTPTPWTWWTSNSHYRLTGADGRDGGVISASIARDGMPVVNVRPDDAAFIVQACNSHDALVDALRACLEAYGISERRTAHGLARAALAVAGA